MFRQARSHFDSSQIVVFAAAVADYTPAKVAEHKIKKSDQAWKIDLIKTKDIAATLGKQKNGQFVVGFALETKNEVENAKKKLEQKYLDLIVLNSLGDEGAGFGHDTNKICIIDRENKLINFELKSKKEVARDIVNEIINRT
jgi:phosphopantothenoylcysteine decarboxylase/phosphopantothenate--cysteine ligase